MRALVATVSVNDRRVLRARSAGNPRRSAVHTLVHDAVVDDDVAGVAQHVEDLECVALHLQPLETSSPFEFVRITSVRSRWMGSSWLAERWNEPSALRAR